MFLSPGWSYSFVSRKQNGSFPSSLPKKIVLKHITCCFLYAGLQVWGENEENGAKQHGFKVVYLIEENLGYREDIRHYIDICGRNQAINFITLPFITWDYYKSIRLL